MPIQSTLPKLEFIRFKDGKDPDALRTIGEVSKALDIRQHVLRYWEEQFPMLQPIKRSGNRRYYRIEDVRVIALIQQLVTNYGYTLKGARLAIENEFKSVSAFRQAVRPAREKRQVMNQIRNKVRSMRTTMAEALGKS